jgi:hypothetical protein
MPSKAIQDCPEILQEPRCNSRKAIRGLVQFCDHGLWIAGDSLLIARDRWHIFHLELTIIPDISAN